MKEERRQLGAYRLLDSIGRGGQGEVFRAHQALLNREVALKVLDLDPIFAEAGQQRARFIREIQIHSGLSHPRLVKVLDGGVVDGIPYLAMELLKGPTLDELLETRQRLSSREARAYALDIIEGLEHLHEKGILHRDLKPRNIIVDDGMGLKILDFGLARSETAAALTAAGQVVGTVLFLSPEILTDLEYSPASDAYALGTILYRMVAGLYPYELRSIDQHASDKIRADPPDVTSITPGLDPRVAHATMGLLARDPGARLSLSGARALLEETASRRVPRVTTSLAPPGPARRSPLIPAAAAILLAVAGAWGFIPRGGPPPAVPSPAGSAPASPTPTRLPLTLEELRTSVGLWHAKLYAELMNKPAGAVDGRYWTRLLVQLAKATRARIPTLNDLGRSLEGQMEADPEGRLALLRELDRATRDELVPLIQEGSRATGQSLLSLEERWKVFECSIPLQLLQKAYHLEGISQPLPDISIPGFTPEPAKRADGEKERFWTPVQTYLLNAEVDQKTLELVGARWMTERSLLKIQDPERYPTRPGGASFLDRHHSTGIAADLRNQRRPSRPDQMEHLEIWITPAGREQASLGEGDLLWVTLPSCVPFPLDWTHMREVPGGRSSSPRVILGRELPPETLGDGRTVPVRIQMESMRLPRPPSLKERSIFINRARVGYL